MKKLITFMAAFAAAALFGADAAKDLILSQRNDANTGNIQRNVTGTADSLVGFDASGHPLSIAAGAGITISGGFINAPAVGTVTSVSFTGGLISVGSPTTTPAFTVAGTSGGIPYFSSTSTWGSSGLLTANALVIGGGAGTAPSTTTTGANVLTAIGNTLNGASGLVGLNSDATLTLGGSFIRTPATITVTAGAGTIDVTKGYSQASVVATTTLTPSAAGTAGQFITLDITADATQRVVTVDTAVDFSVTCAPSLTTTLLLRSTGTGWVLVGGSPNLVDATADTTPATTKIIGTANATTGAMAKSTIAQIVTDANMTVTDVTTNNASTSAHGFLKKLDNDSTHFMNGQGNWAAPSSTASLTATYVGYGDGSNILTGESVFTYDATNNEATIGGVVVGGNRSKAAWTTTGIGLVLQGSTYTDTSSSGTVARQAVHGVAAPTIAASSSTTYSDSSTIEIRGPPVNGSNVTQTRPHSLLIVDSTTANGGSTGGALVVSGTPGTATASVSIGGGYVYAGLNVIADGSVVAGAAQSFGFNGRSGWFSPSNGVLRAANNAGTGFTRLDWALDTTSGSAIGYDAVNSLNVQSGAGSGTWNDPSTATSGTVAVRYALGFTAPTFSSTNATITNTVATTLYIPNEPAAGTNITNTASYAMYIAAGDVRWGGYGAGTLTTDANGVITATSDARLKEVKSPFARGLKDVLALKPVNYRWNEKSGMDIEHDYTGFIAQEVQAVIPEAIGENRDGFLTLSDRPIIAALVNSTKELDEKAGVDWWARGLAGLALLVAIAAYFRKPSVQETNL